MSAFTPPLPSTLKRFFAPDLVFIFGMGYSISFIRLGARGLQNKALKHLKAPNTTIFCRSKKAAPRGKSEQAKHYNYFSSAQSSSPFGGLPFSETAERCRFRPFFFHALQQLRTQLLMRHFATAETQGNFHLVAIFQKTGDVAHFNVVIALIGARTELISLICTCFCFSWLRRVFLACSYIVFAKIHQLANRAAWRWGKSPPNPHLALRPWPKLRVRLPRRAARP